MMAVLDSASATSSFLPAFLVGLCRFAFDASVLVVLALAVAGYFGQSAWLIDMTNFFRPHICALALVIVLFGLLAYSPARAVAGLLVLSAAAYPLLIRSVPAAAASETSNLRLMSANVLFDNYDTQGFLDILNVADPDILVAEEANGHWQPILSAVPSLPFVVGPEFGKGSGVLVAGRYPMTVTQIKGIGLGGPRPELGGGVPLRVVVTRPEQARPLIIYAIHPPTPRSWAGWRSRNLYLQQIAGLVKKDAETADVIVAGDWNTPSWSPFYRDFLESADMRATDGSPWPSPTRFFREFGAPPALGSPIDHIAVTGGIDVARLHVGGPFGSDHLPVTADLRLH